MRLLNEETLGAGYGHATDAHVRASAATLDELAGLATADFGGAGARPLFVRLSHIEHGGFLSNQLFCFGLQPSNGAAQHEGYSDRCPSRSFSAIHARIRLRPSRSEASGQVRFPPPPHA